MVIRCTSYNGQPALRAAEDTRQGVWCAGQKSLLLYSYDGKRLKEAGIASLRRLFPHFNKTNPYFVKGFNTSAAVGYSGIRHSGIEGIITNPLTGALIQDAVITGKGKKKSPKPTVRAIIN